MKMNTKNVAFETIMVFALMMIQVIMQREFTADSNTYLPLTIIAAGLYFLALKRIYGSKWGFVGIGISLALRAILGLPMTFLFFIHLVILSWHLYLQNRQGGKK